MPRLSIALIRLAVAFSIGGLSGSAWAAGDAPDLETARRAHWAYQPITKPPLPQVRNNSASVTPIDNFVVAALEHSGLGMSPLAEKLALIRRATYDLTGLPPTWDEVQSFLNDDSSEAFVKVIDRLLVSPRYGERWGRHWLDIARYADTHGGGALGATKFPYSYTYRDYVIQALNRDLPYNQFLLEQIAADQLDSGDKPRALAAIGFLTVGRQFRNQHDVIDDRIDVVTRGLLGLTVTCARCHDHKYDAIPTEDYYSLCAIFAASERPDELPVVGNPEESPEYRDYLGERRRRKLARDDFVRDQSEVLRGRLRMQVGIYLAAIARGIPEQDLSVVFLSYRTEDIRPSILEGWRKYLAEVASYDDPVFGAWHRLSRLSKDEFAARSAAVLQELRAENDGPSADPTKYHRYDATPPRWNPRVLDALASRSLASMLDVAEIYGNLFADVQREWTQGLATTSREAAAGVPDVSDDSPEHTSVNSPVNRQLRHHLHALGSPTAVPDEIARTLLNRPLVEQAGKLNGAVADLDLNAPGSPPRAMSLVERDDPPVQCILVYGNPIDRGPPVHPRFLTVLTGSNGQIYSDGRRRLGLAQSIVDPANPLTCRVAVNWVWQHHFGKGLVRTPDDFGSRGESPTHPELLDYLAATFIEDGWSLKRLHRRIMLSATYQQSALENAQYRLQDPENRLLWRMPRMRLEFEAMRDAMLAVAGRLDTTMGGRPFDLFAQPAVPRRTVYGFVNRDVVPSLFSAFDVADPNACAATRPETTVPQQALFALNSDFIDEQAKHLAELDEVQEAENEVERISLLYRRALARQPSEAELSTSLEYVRSQSSTAGSSAWERLAQVLLATNEFVFLD